VVRFAPELCWIHAELSGHLNLCVGQSIAFPCFDPGPQLLWDEAILGHDLAVCSRRHNVQFNRGRFSEIPENIESRRWTAHCGIPCSNGHWVQRCGDHLGSAVYSGALIAQLPPPRERTSTIGQNRGDTGRTSHHGACLSALLHCNSCVVLVLRHQRRAIVHFNVTEHPTAQCIA